MNVVKEFGKFWYELLVGDDWKIAVSVVIALVVSGLLLTQTSAGDHTVAIVGAVLVVACFSASLLIDVREKR